MIKKKKKEEWLGLCMLILTDAMCMQEVWGIQFVHV